MTTVMVLTTVTVLKIGAWKFREYCATVGMTMGLGVRFERMGQVIFLRSAKSPEGALDDSVVRSLMLLIKTARGEYLLFFNLSFTYALLEDLDGITD
jgi:hypothetical protein